MEVAELGSSAEAPAGAKSGGITELGTLAVQTLPAALAGLIGLLRSWMSHGRDSRIKVIMRGPVIVAVVDRLEQDDPGR